MSLCFNPYRRFFGRLKFIVIAAALVAAASSYCVKPSFAQMEAGTVSRHDSDLSNAPYMSPNLYPDHEKQTIIDREHQQSITQNDPQISSERLLSSGEEAARPGVFPMQGDIPAVLPARAVSSSSNAAGTANNVDDNAPVDFAADNLSYDDKTGIVTATGNVELVQSGRILRANRVMYYKFEDRVVASGNVIINEPNGDIHFMDEISLEDEMKRGIVVGLQSHMADGGRFFADRGQRFNEQLLAMYNASYTPCACDGTGGTPAWQIKAKEVTMDGENNRINYKNARFELFGVPVAWLPFMSHADGTVDQKSGFLTPSAGYDSDLGFIVTQNYYWAIDKHRDATFGVMLTSREVPVGLAQYRHRFENAVIEFGGSGTYVNRTDSIAGEEVVTDEEFRGHFYAEGRWDINDKWRAGLDLEIASDDQYLREYDFSSEDVLENEIYVERFEGRDYVSGRLLAFQDVRVEEEQSDQPNILPEVELDFVGKPNAMLGGRWNVNLTSLALHREDGQDMTRLITKANWQRRFVTNFGVISTVEVGGRGDAYWVNDRDVATFGSGRSNDTAETRTHAYANMVTSYPFVKPITRMDAVIEPMASVTISPNIDNDVNEIPNEDSQDVQLDAVNLFDVDHFPGEDRIEDKSRATYGMRMGLYGHKGSFGEIFAGQSYRFDNDDNPFPEGSGLSRQESDYVGQIAASYDGRFTGNYRFQLDSEDVSSQRHEFDGTADFGRFDLSGRYLFAESLEGTDIEESREQAFLAAGLDLTSSWRIRGSVLQDLGEDPGLREATAGIDYFGCCVSASVTARRTNTSDASGDSGTDIMFRLGLKGLGEFQSGGTGIGARTE